MVYSGELYVGPTDDPDRYQLWRRLGSGGEGEVWQGTRQLADGSIGVAVKYYHEARFGVIESLDQLSTRLETQAARLRALHTPGLAAVHESFLGPDPHAAGESQAGRSSAYFVMDYIDGVPLSEWATTEASMFGRLGVLDDAAGALDALHQAEQLHADIKPSNLLVHTLNIPGGGQVPTAVLVDFGVMRSINLGPPSKVIGTQGFIAPELQTGGAYSPASDLYAFAMVSAGLVCDGQTSRDIVQAARAAGLPDEGISVLLAGVDADPGRRTSELEHGVAGWLSRLRSGLSTTHTFAAPSTVIVPDSADGDSDQSSTPEHQANHDRTAGPQSHDEGLGSPKPRTQTTTARPDPGTAQPSDQPNTPRQPKHDPAAGSRRPDESHKRRPAATTTRLVSDRSSPGSVAGTTATATPTRRPSRTLFVAIAGLLAVVGIGGALALRPNGDQLASSQPSTSSTALATPDSSVVTPTTSEGESVDIQSQTCANGLVIPADQTCPTSQSTQVCPGGETIPANQTCPTPPPARVEFQVSDFNTSDWDIVTNWRPSTSPPGEFTPGYGGTFEYDWLIQSPTVAGVERPGIDVWLIYNGSCWDPAELGPLSTIQFTLDRRAVSANAGATVITEDEADFGPSESFAIRQGSNLIAASNENRAILSTAFDSFQSGVLTIQDFRSTIQTGANAEPICFGVLRNSSTRRGPGKSQRHSLDNFRVIAIGQG